MAQRIRTGDGKGWREVQGMTGVERVFSLGQWILKSVLLLDHAHSQTFYTSWHFNLSVHLFTCNSVYLSMLIHFLTFLIPC